MSNQDDININKDRPEREDIDDEVASNHELQMRLLRVEERQIQTVETLERINKTINGEISDIKQTQEELRKQHTKLWYVYQFLKWGGGTAGLLSLAASQIL